MIISVQQIYLYNPYYETLYCEVGNNVDCILKIYIRQSEVSYYCENQDVTEEESINSLVYSSPCFIHWYNLPYCK